MKTQILRIGGLGLLLAGVVAVTGSSNTPSGVAVVSNNPPPMVSNAGPDLLTYQPAPDVAQITNPAATATNEDKVVASPTLPVDVQFSHNFAEVTKLLQAGVDESVVRSFISNTSGAFNIGSNEIVYLNDLGVSGDIIMAMMQHDQAGNVAVQSAPPPAAAPPPPAAETGGYLTETAETVPVEYAQPSPVVVPQQPVTVNYFYDTLSPYGTWVDIAGYGPCWQPIIVLRQPMWRPYCDNGRWIYTDCGWYWASDYSWGATFHYGRWFNHPRRGWCWAPDTVWGPAWVSWRSSRDYCGWAPLPPGTGWIPGVGFGYRNHGVGFGFDFGLTADCFTFVHYNRFRDRHVGRHAMSRHDTARVMNQTTVVNNFIHGDNNTIINRGIAPERVAAASGRKVTPVPVNQVAANRPFGSPGQRGSPGFNRPTGSQLLHGSRPGYPGNDSSRSLNANGGNRIVPTSPFSPAASATPNLGSSVQRQHPVTGMAGLQTPNRPINQFRVRPDNTAPATTVQTTVPSAPPTTAAPQVERRPAGPFRQQFTVPQHNAASWPQAAITRPSVTSARVRPDVSPRQATVIERPQFQSPPVVARPQVMPQAPVVSTPRPAPDLGHRASVSRNFSPAAATVDHRQRGDQDGQGQRFGRR